MLNYTRMFDKQLAFADKDMKNRKVKEAKNENEKNKIKSNMLFGCSSKFYIYVLKKYFFSLIKIKRNYIFNDLKVSSPSWNPVH